MEKSSFLSGIVVVLCIVISKNVGNFWGIFDLCPAFQDYCQPVNIRIIGLPLLSAAKQKLLAADSFIKSPRFCSNFFFNARSCP